MARPRILRADPHDREIVRLAVPAFGALAAEPLYVLADTAVVGRLGTDPLAGLAIAGIVLTAVFGIFNFLAYGTTAAVARRIGAGDRKRAAEQGVDGMWLGLFLGLGLTAAGLALAPWIVDVMGASSDVRPYALTYLRISLLGAPFMLVALAGTGYLRGCQDTATPLWIAVGANVANLVLELVLVFRFDLGIAGSAWGTVVAQVGAATVYVAIVGRSVRAEHAAITPDRAGIRAAAVVGGHLVVRTGSLLLALLVATAVASRIGDDEVAAHQIAFQVWTFLAYALDAIAIAGQAIVGRVLGAGDARAARAAARRMLEWGVVGGVAVGLLVAAGTSVLPMLFSRDEGVRGAASEVLWVVAALQPLNALVFVLDGILIGAGDSRYLAVAMAGATLVYLPIAGLVVALDGGLLALWGALAVFMVARFVGMGGRFRTERWIITGASR
ncbi:MAG TPA: MATE family efflux transporter [Acidimicrobiia bacterium]|nr:MATE family efflux transporter [Acidimicrobiia bacterium]